MLMELFYVFLILGIIFLLTGIFTEYTEHKYWTIIFAFLSMSMWFICAFGVLDLETGYQLFNSTSGNIETGYQSYHKLPWLSYIFLGVAVSCLIYFVTLAFKPLIQAFAGTKYNRRR